MVELLRFGCPRLTSFIDRAFMYNSFQMKCDHQVCLQAEMLAASSGRGKSLSNAASLKINQNDANFQASRDTLARQDYYKGIFTLQPRKKTAAFSKLTMQESSVLTLWALT